MADDCLVLCYPDPDEAFDALELKAFEMRCLLDYVAGIHPTTLSPEWFEVQRIALDEAWLTYSGRVSGNTC